MKRIAWIIAVGALGAAPVALARGVTPYLPLNLEPEIESQIERVLILAGKPVMRRPIAAATVEDALVKACDIDRVLCEQVTRYLSRYKHTSDLTHLSVEGAATHGANDPLPNRYGMRNDSAWDASLGLYVQPSDYLLVSLGANAYDGHVDYSGSFLSVGFSKAQLDLGYKPHWMSPLPDSSMLMSSEAPTMPSIGISNYEPLTRLGLSYDVWQARMSRSDHIVWQDGYTSGNPLVAGVQLVAEPVSGWAFGLNRLVQYGGGARGGSSIHTLYHAFINPAGAQGGDQASDPNAINQQASFTSSFLFGGPVPFAVFAEYAGEDTSHGQNYLLGNSALSWGIRFPHLGPRLDLLLEASEWQNSWYVHNIWQDGMTNHGLVIGNWFGDQRQFNDGVGGRSATVQLNWDATFGGQVQLRYRTLANQIYGAHPYHHYHEASLSYARPWNGVIVGGEVDAGSDVFGKSFSRLAGFIRYNDPNAHTGISSGSGVSPGAEERGEIFLSAGVNVMRLEYQFTSTSPTEQHGAKSGGSFGIGARRAVSPHNDLGARIDVDTTEGGTLLGVRLIDWRWRFDNPLALGAFLGAARYSLATPAYGVYIGAGLQWRNVVRGLDVGLEGRFYDDIARDRLLPGEPNPNPIQPDSFYSFYGAVFSLSYHF
jgi:hypothetical protein